MLLSNYVPEVNRKEECSELQMIINSENTTKNGDNGNNGDNRKWDLDKKNDTWHHSTVWIDFSKIWEKAWSIYPDRNQANQINPSPVPDKNWHEARIKLINSQIQVTT